MFFSKTICWISVVQFGVKRARYKKLCGEAKKFLFLHSTDGIFYNLEWNFNISHFTPGCPIPKILNEFFLLVKSSNNVLFLNLIHSRSSDLIVVIQCFLRNPKQGEFEKSQEHVLRSFKNVTRIIWTIIPDWRVFGILSRLFSLDHCLLDCGHFVLSVRHAR